MATFLPTFFSPRFFGSKLFLRNQTQRLLVFNRTLHTEETKQNEKQVDKNENQDQNQNQEKHQEKDQINNQIEKNEIFNPYEILGVTKESTFEEIRQNYYKLAMRYHPDTSMEETQHAKLMFSRVGEAYKVLTENQNPLSDSNETPIQTEFVKKRMDEIMLGYRATRGAQTFYSKFSNFFGETYDSLIHQHVNQRDLVSAFDTFRLMREAGKRPTVSTIEMLMRGCTLSMRQSKDFETADHFTKNLWTTSMELFYSIQSYGLKPDIWSYNEAIRASGKAGNIRKVLELFDIMCKKPLTLPTNVVYNNALEACVKTGNYDKSFLLFDEMKEIQKSVWFKGKFRNDPVTFGLLLKSGVEGKLLNRVPEVIKIMDRDGLKMTPQTAHTVIQAAVKNTELDVAQEIMLAIQKQGIKLQHQTIDLLKNVHLPPGDNSNQQQQ